MEKTISKAAQKRHAQAQAEIALSRRSEIEAMRATGKKPTEIAVWLGQYGFEGTGATLNGILPWTPADRPPATPPQPQPKKPGRPRKYADAAERVRAFRGNAEKAGHRFDLYLGEEAAAVVRRVQEENRQSASEVVDAVLRGDLSLGNGRVSAQLKSLPETHKAPPEIGRLEAQIILLNAELLTRGRELEDAQQEITALKRVSKSLPATRRKAALPPIPPRTPAPIVRDLAASAKLLQTKRAQIAKLEKDVDAIERRFRQTVEECKLL